MGKFIAWWCQQTFCSQKFVENDQQCFAFTPQANFPANNLNFNWISRWWDQILAIFFLFFYLTKNMNFENYLTPLWYFVELMSKNRIVCHKIIIIERKEKVYAYANEAINSKSRFFTFSTAILSTPLAYQGLHCTLLYIQG